MSCAPDSYCPGSGAPIPWLRRKTGGDHQTTHTDSHRRDRRCHRRRQVSDILYHGTRELGAELEMRPPQLQQLICGSGKINISHDESSKNYLLDIDFVLISLVGRQRRGRGREGVASAL